jgi:hypothetical protein
MADAVIEAPGSMSDLDGPERMTSLSALAAPYCYREVVHGTLT